MAYVNITNNPNWEYDNDPADPEGALSTVWKQGKTLTYSGNVFNYTAFQLPPGGTTGNAPPNSFFRYNSGNSAFEYFKKENFDANVIAAGAVEGTWFGYWGSSGGGINVIVANGGTGENPNVGTIGHRGIRYTPRQPSTSGATPNEIYMKCRHKTLQTNQTPVLSEINKTFWDAQT
jgi:hypothetical protein